MTIRVERATLEQAMEIARLNMFVQIRHVEAHPTLFKQPNDLTEVTSFFKTLLNADKNILCVAYIEDLAVGYIWAEFDIRPEIALMFARSRTYIHHISVDEAYRKRGVGSALIAEIVRRSKEADINKMTLTTWSFNQEAQRFFQGHGFETYSLKMWSDID